MRLMFPRHACYRCASVSVCVYECVRVYVCAGLCECVRVASLTRFQKRAIAGKATEHPNGPDRR